MDLPIIYNGQEVGRVRSGEAELWSLEFHDEFDKKLNEGLEVMFLFAYDRVGEEYIEKALEVKDLGGS